MTDQQFIGFVHNPLVPEALRIVNELSSQLGRDSCWIVSANELELMSFYDTHGKTDC